MARTGLKLSDMGLSELHEAFAAQYLGCERGLRLTEKRDMINVDGSGISVGDPVGATGCRIVVTLIHEIMRHSVRYGLATLCGGGEQGMAKIIEQP